MSTAPADFQPGLDTLRARVAEALHDFLTRQCGQLSAIGPELAPVTEAITAFLDGGKRLRPAFAYWGWRGAGGDRTDDAAVLRAAAALELVQLGALVHDDVMDASASRRGRPSVHERFAALHRERGWSGDPVSFGRAAAILVGDLGLIWAETMLAWSGLPPDVLARLAPVYDAMRTEVMAGQYLDVLAQVRGRGPTRDGEVATASGDLGRDEVADALRVARYKAASYTVERPLHLGALMAAGEVATAELRRAYTEYGVAVGQAFQLRDDLLGVFGDPGQTGKPAGDDLREGKRTVLIALARAAATGSQRALLDRRLGRADLAASDVEQLRALLVDTGAVAHVEAMIREQTDTALRALKDAPVAPDAARVLARLAITATDRTS